MISMANRPESGQKISYFLPLKSVIYWKKRRKKEYAVMRGKKVFIKKLWTNLIIFAAFMLVLVGSAAMLGNILWRNANEMGLSLVRNYSSTEEQTIKNCETILEICTNYIAEREQTDISVSELREGLYPFMDGLTDVYGRDNIQMYGGAFGGTAMVSNDPEIEAMSGYDVTGAPWYQGTAAANGETYISPVYANAATGLPVVTVQDDP